MSPMAALRQRANIHNGQDSPTNHLNTIDGDGMKTVLDKHTD